MSLALPSHLSQDSLNKHFQPGLGPFIAQQRLICLTKDLLHSGDPHPIFSLAFLHLFPQTFLFLAASPSSHIPGLWSIGKGPLCRARSCSLAGKCDSLLPEVSSRWKGVGKVSIRLRCASNPLPLPCWFNSRLAGSVHPSWIFPCAPNSAWEWHQRNSPKPEGTLELAAIDKDVLGRKFPVKTPSPG